MGFDVNPLSNKPIIREAASMQNDGGAGNLGYFEQDGKKEKKREEESIFSNEKELDSFKKENFEEDEQVDFSISRLIAEVIFSVKNWFNSLFK